MSTISRGAPQLPSHECVRPPRPHTSLGHISPPSRGPASPPPISLPPLNTTHKSLARTRLVPKSNSIHTLQPSYSPVSDQTISPSSVLSFAPPPNDRFIHSSPSSSTLSSPCPELTPPTSQ